MIGDAVSKEELATFLLPSKPGQPPADELAGLWELFAQIGKTWGTDGDDPLYQRSQWLEFIAAMTDQEPSYLAEYRNALLVLAELRRLYGEGMWPKLFFEHGVSGPPTTRLAHLRKFVVEEFIKVWLTSGGFK